jgi:hypothetical protein
VSRAPVLYIGAAAPLFERAREWTVAVPGATVEARQQALATFPMLDEIEAYGLATSEGLGALRFRTGRQVNQARVAKALQGWQPDAPIEWVDRVEPIPPIDYRQGIAALQEALRELPVAIEVRIGLTLQALQRDLARLRPELVLLYCHGTEEGCLVFEDGRGVAEYVSGVRAACDTERRFLREQRVQQVERECPQAQDGTERRMARVLVGGPHFGHRQEDGECDGDAVKRERINRRQGV